MPPDPPANAVNVARGGHYRYFWIQWRNAIGIFGLRRRPTLHRSSPRKLGQGFRDYLDYAVEAEALGYVSSFLVRAPSHRLEPGFRDLDAADRARHAHHHLAAWLRGDRSALHNPGAARRAGPRRSIPSPAAGSISASARATATTSSPASTSAPDEAEPRFEELIEVMTKAFHVASAASRTTENSGASTTSWSNRRRRRSRIRRSGSQPAAKPRSAVVPRSAAST